MREKLRGDAMADQWSDLGLLWLRMLVGISIATHGFAKIFGGQMDGFAEGVAQMGFPLPVVSAWAAALSEFVGGICLAAGVGVRIAALFVFCTMSVALVIHHRQDPFNVKELAYLYWAASGTLIMLGGGRFTLTSLFQKKPVYSHNGTGSQL